MVGTLLCVDPDEGVRGATATALRDATGCAVRECETAAAALEALDEGVDCVVTAQELPDGTGLELLDRVRERTPDTACVLFTDAAPADLDTAALDDPVVEYVPKGGPMAREELTDLVAASVADRTQTAYPLPTAEAERLAALAAYVPEPADLQGSFDRLTAIACGLLDAPMAGIGFVDAHEQSFVACHGIDIGTVPREETVCTYAILESTVTTITDIRTDPRFEENEGLRETGIRGYASANVVADGQPVGTFCVYATEPREWTDEDREHLRLLAEEASEQLRLRRRAREGDDAAGDRPADPAAAGDGGGDG